MFVIRLPQLAVLAKILCLLMVVMCGAVPAMVRSVSLYSTCSSGNVTVLGHTIKAMGRDDHNAPYQKLTTQSEDFSRKLYIFAEETQRYICFNKRWKLVGLREKLKTSMCQFYEDYNGSYLTYRSVVDGTRYIGFNKMGKQIKNPRRQECFNFIKYNPHADINHHNNLVNADMGGMDPRDPYVVSKKPLPLVRAAKKNSLSQVDSARGIVHTTHHHRHSNHWKMRQGEKVSTPRRRHNSRLLVEASKY